MRKQLWYESGNDLFKSGHISHESMPVPAWVIVAWFGYVETHVVHGRIWTRLTGRLWSKVLPAYGDPLCFASCSGLFRFEQKYTRQEHDYAVGWDLLSPAYREWYRKANDDE